MAITINQIGILYNKQDLTEEAVSWNLRSLLIRLEIKVPHEINLQYLKTQHDKLGTKRFNELLEEQLDENDKNIVTEKLKQSGVYGEVSDV